METLKNENGFSLKKRTLKRWIYEHGFTQPFVARRLNMGVEEFKRKLSEKEHFSKAQIRALVYLMGAEAAFNVLYFPSLEEKCRVYHEAFWQKGDE